LRVQVVQAAGAFDARLRLDHERGINAAFMIPFASVR
jgi:hypothetical protein